jgi:hypothetical protein
LIPINSPGFSAICCLLLPGITINGPTQLIATKLAAGWLACGGGATNYFVAETGAYLSRDPLRREAITIQYMDYSGYPRTTSLPPFSSGVYHRPDFQ